VAEVGRQTTSTHRAKLGARDPVGMMKNDDDRLGSRILIAFIQLSLDQSWFDFG
jgi:hypothetical protein